MKHFVYFSAHARTSGNFDPHDLVNAGRLDIAAHVFINSFFISHQKRDDVTLHFVLYGMPDPPKHISIRLTELDQSKTGDPFAMAISKKDLGSLFKKILYKYQKGENREVFPGIFVEKKSFLQVLEDLESQGVELFILDKKGKDIRAVDIPKDCAFVLGDQDGMPEKELRRLKKTKQTVTVGPQVYFASHVVTIVNNELDRRGI